MLVRVIKTAFWGALIGLLLGVVYGGVMAAMYGLPFAGASDIGMKVFHRGMVFPGLIVYAPTLAGIGAGAGAVVPFLKRFWADRRE